MFSPWAMKGERPLSRFMHYAEGEAPGDRGVLCVDLPSISVSKQGVLCQDHPEAPSRSQVDCSLLSLGDRAVQINHIRALTCQPCWALLGPAGEGRRNVARG